VDRGLLFAGMQIGMPVEERFGGCTKKRANVDAGSIKLGEFYGANGAVFAADADGRVVWLLMRPVVDQVCGYCKHKFGKAESAYMGDTLGPVADVVQKGKDIDHLMLRCVYTSELRVRNYIYDLYSAKEFLGYTVGFIDEIEDASQ
jgi:hypothetical protein